MTKEELQKLKSMSARDRVKKYLPMLQKGEITQQQYGFVISVGREAQAEKDAEQMTARIKQEFGKEPDETTTQDDIEAGRTQKERLLLLLSDNKWHDTPEILQKVYGLDRSGIARIGARIADLKEDGHRIDGRKKTQTVYEYRLLPERNTGPEP